MTKEELEKEAKTECFMLTVNTIGIDQRDVELAYVMGAEPREKRIAELEEKLANADYQLEGRDLEIKELKAQIEKMRCCYNCSKWNDGQCADIPDSGYCCADFVCEDWEIKENDNAKK